MENPLTFTSLRNIHSRICAAQRLHTQTIFFVSFCLGLLFFCTVWSTLIRISLTKALVLWWCDNKSDLIWFDLIWEWQQVYNQISKFYSTVSKSTTIPGRKIGLLIFASHSCSVCLHSVHECADDDVLCLREQGAQRYANTYIDRQVGKTIKTLGPSVFIGQTFLGPTPSTENINTDKYI